jgi:hypothetical protein
MWESFSSLSKASTYGYITTLFLVAFNALIVKAPTHRSQHDVHEVRQTNEHRQDTIFDNHLPMYIKTHLSRQPAQKGILCRKPS